MRGRKPEERHTPEGWIEEPREERRRSRRGGRGLARGPLRRLDRPRKIVLRDFLLYELKLLLDGAKSFVITWAALGAVALDMLLPGEVPGHRFYAVMRIGERLDRWLSLYGIADAAEADSEGMFGVSRAGSPTLLGQVEAFVHRAVVGDDGDFEDDARDRHPDLESDGGFDETGGPEADLPPAHETGTTQSSAQWPDPGAEAAGPGAPSAHEAPAETPLPSYVRAERATRVVSALFDRALAALDRGMDALDREPERAGAPGESPLAESHEAGAADPVADGGAPAGGEVGERPPQSS